MARSPKKDAALKFVSFVTTNEAAALSFYKSSSRPPALRSLLNICQQDPKLNAFCRQTLIARSWPNPDRAQVDIIFSDLVKNVTSGRLSVTESLRKAESAVTDLIRSLHPLR